MRWIRVVVIVVFAAAIILFCIQNLEVVTLSFARFSVRAPLAMLTALFYLFGAATGGSLFALLRRSVRVSRTSWPASS